MVFQSLFERQESKSKVKIIARQEVISNADWIKLKHEAKTVFASPEKKHSKMRASHKGRGREEFPGSFGEGCFGG